MDETTKKNVTVALKMARMRLSLESYELKTMRHSSSSKYISSSYWNEMASKMHEMGIETM